MPANSLIMDLNAFSREFFALYGNPGDKPSLYFAPGRVNLIGEHTDYNGGFVLPFALQYGTYLMIRPASDPVIKLASANFTEKISIPLGPHFSRQPVRWFNYPLGVMDQMMLKGIAMKGMELFYYGDIPNNAGLSSSASIEMVTAFAFNEILSAGLEMIDLIRLSRKAENQFVGVSCGIMDQFAVGMGETNHAVFLNCHTLDFKLIPVLIEGFRLIIANTNKPRGLADSNYNERVSECSQAVDYLKKVFDITRLGELGYPQFFKAQDNIPDEIVRKRARHVVSENQRVLNAVSCLLKSDLDHFGALMNASHESLKENYEVTGIELDTLVDEARKINGVIGARMTGAGFGGCTVNLVREDAITRFIQQVGEEYSRKVNIIPDFYIAEIGNGVRKILNS